MVDEVEGRFVAASNATLLGTTRDGVRVVYKPHAGVRPLWDFPAETLALREVWTARVGEVLAPGWVPETVIGDGVYGPGAVQRWIEPDPAFDPLPAVRRGDAALWPLAVLDVVCNNADRKLGHILRRAGSGTLFGIDHGLTFHPEDKLRTVLWAFAGRAIPDVELTRLDATRRALADVWSGPLERDLGDDAVDALRSRIAGLLERGHHPEPPQERPAYPWPIG